VLEVMLDRMAKADGWEGAFVAVSVSLGASVEEALASLDAKATGRVESFAKSLVHPVREARAKVLASGLARVAMAIEAARLA
jgi:hypothetical protein